MPFRVGRLFGLVCACAGLNAGAARAQTLPAGPVAFADGRVTVAGDVSASYGSDDPGFFDYTDYDHSALRLVRINLSGTVKANEHFSVLADVQTENLDSVRPYALYLRIRPWTTRAIDVQIGRVPPTFGAFGRRNYASDNPLIGYPLAYQYLTTIRPDAVPANADELLQKRSSGWLLRYSVGDLSLSHGVPLVNGFRWDTGVQVHVGLLRDNQLTVTGSVTAGSLSNPLFDDDNAGKQYAARVDARPVMGIVAGLSFARGAFMRDDAVRAAVGSAHGSDFTQTAWGGDLEYARDHFVIRTELIATGWEMPVCTACDPSRRSPAIPSPLRAISTSIEGKYAIRPGLYGAARVGHLGFNEIEGTTTTAPWDAPVTRFEIGAGYSLQRNLLLKGSFQTNRRDGGRLLGKANQVATQVVYWF